MDLTTLIDAGLTGSAPTRSACRALLQTPDDDLLPLLHAAFCVRKHYFGHRVQIHILKNAKSGLCPEDCHYCSQSSVSDAPIDRYPLRPKAEIVSDALSAHSGGAMRYCIVNSGRGPTDGEVGAVCEAVEEIKQTVDIDICCCLGLLSESQAHQLKFAGVGRVNHNLNTSQNHHDTICTTHTYEDRIRTLQIVKEAGLATCSGGILGMGESPEDILDLAFALRDIGADSIPVNFLHPIDGTPLSGREDLTPRDCLRILCLFRFVNPTREIRVAGGRERNIRSLQPLSLYPANSLFMEGYLTTDGQGANETHQMIEDLGFQIDQGTPSPATDFVDTISIA